MLLKRKLISYLNYLPKIYKKINKIKFILVKIWNMFRKVYEKFRNTINVWIKNNQFLRKYLDIH